MVATARCHETYSRAAESRSKRSPFWRASTNTCCCKVRQRHGVVCLVTRQPEHDAVVFCACVEVILADARTTSGVRPLRSRAPRNPHGSHALFATLLQHRVRTDVLRVRRQFWLELFFQHDVLHDGHVVTTACDGELSSSRNSLACGDGSLGCRPPLDRNVKNVRLWWQWLSVGCEAPQPCN